MQFDSISHNSPFLESNVYKGVRESSLYQRMSATESSGVGGVISHGRATFPRTTAVYRMEAVERGREEGKKVRLRKKQKEKE